MLKIFGGGEKIFQSKLAKYGAIFITVLFIGTAFIVPVESVKMNEKKQSLFESFKDKNYPFFETEEKDLDPVWLDRAYDQEDTVALNQDDNDDAGYKRDAGDDMRRAFPLYPGEIIDYFPGRSNTGKISSSSDVDWYFFSACEGQNIEMTLSVPSGNNYDLAVWDEYEEIIAESSNSGSSQESLSFMPDYTSYFFVQVLPIEASGEGQYTLDINVNDQNDANTGNDAGDGFSSATEISPGEYFGYLDRSDEEDWYKFDVSDGQGLEFILEMDDYAVYSDFDIYLYDPDENLVHYEKYYYDDKLEYIADKTGEWRVQIKIFPGFSDTPDPSGWDYFAYGSGAYRLEFNFDSQAQNPPGPIPQPDITPISQTYVVNNDANSNKDEFSYLAAIPACNYIQGGKRYVSPIIYEGDSTPTNWYGDVDDTTDYLVEDWNNYLSNKGKTAEIYNVKSNPIDAAADIAKRAWDSSNLAVVAVDGSSYEDTTETVLDKSGSLKREVDVKTIQSSSSEISEEYGYPMYVGDKWCAISVEVNGITRISSDPGAVLTQVFPKYIFVGSDDWPVPYDGTGDATDIYYPVVTRGIWAASSGLSKSHWSDMKITKYAGDRYKIKVDSSDSTLKVTVNTDSSSDLLVFLVDPKGHLRAPDPPTWVGPINPIHEWNGLENPASNPWRSWEPDPHTEFSAEVLHPEEGTWTAIVVPRYNSGSSSVSYSIKGEIKTLNRKRIDASLSAANAAVIASLEHVPLLYVKEDSIPSQTSSAFASLGINQVIFVEKNSIGQGVRNKLPNVKSDLNTMQKIIDYIKSNSKSENFISITSLKTGKGFYAPTAMLAAYHGSPVLRIGDAKPDNSQNSLVFVSQMNENAFIVDASTKNILWTYPSGWNPDDPHPAEVPEEYIYLGSTDDAIYCLDKSNGEMIWYSPVLDFESKGISGDVYFSPDDDKIHVFDNSDTEIWVSPILSPGGYTPAGMANRIDTWRLWAGDYYHGIRAPGHLPVHDQPLPSTFQMIIDVIKYFISGGDDGQLPPQGLDAKKTWNMEMYTGIHDWIDNYGLDVNGDEAYVFVAPRKDIRIEAHSIMMGRESYSGHIPGETPAYASAIINRNILYPAIIDANPYKDVTTTQFMNFPDGGQWTLNNGERVSSYSSRLVKNVFSSHGRTYDGHCLWDAHLKRINDGAGLMYYSGHGTGGSGVSAQYVQTSHSNYPGQVWYDAWRGYMYDNWKTPRDNGRRWYNPEPPNLYDIIHFKWVDQLMENLKSQAVFYMSCSTAQHFGPTVYLDHGALLWYGNAGAGLCPEADIMDDVVFEKTMLYGESLGHAYAEEVWLHYRDFTTNDPTSMYGPSSTGSYPISTVQCIYGDPTTIVYSPDWEVPDPIEPGDGKEKSKTDTDDQKTISEIIEQFLNNHPVIEKLIKRVLMVSKNL